MSPGQRQYSFDVKNKAKTSRLDAHSQQQLSVTTRSSHQVCFCSFYHAGTRSHQYSCSRFNILAAWPQFRSYITRIPSERRALLCNVYDAFTARSTRHASRNLADASTSHLELTARMRWKLNPNLCAKFFSDYI